MSDAFDPNLAVKYGTFVSAAYAMYEANPSSLQPPPNNIPDGYTLAAWITMNDFGFGNSQPTFYGFLASDDADPTSFVMAIRGTSSALEWWDNAHALFTTFKNTVSGGNVSLGFDTIYGTLQVEDVSPTQTRAAAGASFAEQVAAVVQSRTVSNGARIDTAKLIVVGHSLGAALATLYVADNGINNRIPIPTVYTFASPRVGDATFVAAYNALGLTSWRVVNKPELVPNLPPDIFGYAHVDEIQLIDSSGKVNDGIACALSLETYLHMLDSSVKLSAGCDKSSAQNRRFASQTGRLIGNVAQPLNATNTSQPIRLATPSVVINLTMSENR
jgi:Lipase (class 3)